MQRREDLGKPGNESVIKINTAEKTLKLNLGPGKHHIGDCIHFLGQRNDAPGVDRVAEERHRGGAEGALGAIYLEARAGEARKDLTKILLMAGRGRAGNEDVIQVNKNE